MNDELASNIYSSPNAFMLGSYALVFCRSLASSYTMQWRCPSTTTAVLVSDIGTSTALIVVKLLICYPVCSCSLSDAGLGASSCAASPLAALCTTMSLSCSLLSTSFFSNTTALSCNLLLFSLFNHATSMSCSLLSLFFAYATTLSVLLPAC